MTGKIVEINEEKIKDHLGQFVKNTIEETLNLMLEAEADELCNAQRYERSSDRQDTGAAIMGGNYLR